MVEKLNKVVHAERQLVQQLGREPTPEEIAESSSARCARCATILRMAQQPISLEKPIGEEDDSELGDFVEDDRPSRHALRHRRRALAHARGGRPRVQHHPRADPPDREPDAEKAQTLPERSSCARPPSRSGRKSQAVPRGGLRRRNALN
jgi:hypothetical protein